MIEKKREREREGGREEVRAIGRGRERVIDEHRENKNDAMQCKGGVTAMQDV